MRSRLTHLRASALAALAIALLQAQVRADSPAVRLSDAGQSGVFNVKDGQATVDRVADPAVGERVLKLDYTLPKGSAAGVWTRAFPGGLDPEHVDVAELAVKGDGTGRGDAALEIKGTSGTQRIPLGPRPEWSRSEHPIEWSRIGSVNEVVVSVGQVGDSPATGTLWLDVRFAKIPWTRKLADSPLGKFAGVLVVAGLAALLTALGLRAVGSGEGREAVGLRRDVVQGVGSVLAALLAFWIFEAGGWGPEGPGWYSLGFAIAGASLLKWWKTGLTDRYVTPGDVFQDTLAVGVLAASASPMAISQAPSDWSEVLQLSQFVAAVAAFVYVAVVANRLAVTGRHPGAVVAGLIVGTPYAVGMLVMLSASGMVGSLGGLAPGDWPEAREFLGRLLVLFAFNEVVANGLGLATRRKWLTSIWGHLALLVVAALAIAGPPIADLGSGEWAAGFGPWGRLAVAVATTALSQAGLWGEVYLVTGLLLDAVQGSAPSRSSAFNHPLLGIKKGMIYSGTFMAILYGLGALGSIPGVWAAAERAPVVISVLFGAVSFPLVKTIFETFDGSTGFYRRVFRAYRSPLLYGRGAVVGLGLGLGIALTIGGWTIPGRAGFGFAIGAVAFAGINALGDIFEASRGRGRVLSWRVYLVQGLLGGFIGAALGFYFDAAQIEVIVDKFHKYLGVNAYSEPVDIRPLLSNWGLLHLGTQSGGVKLLFNEALAGVIEWAVPAWLFAINAKFMAAFFQREAAPIKGLFTRDGMLGLTQNMIFVFRWGLWMSPIIKSFLRPMGDPTWYNQDGAIRTGLAIYHDLTQSPGAFRAWSLHVFILLVAYDLIRVLIWLDHMGLRVATLVNLSFLGMDRLDARLSRFVAPASTARCIPEAVKRFTTWAPLLIPFYIPRGNDWDVAWNGAQAIRAQAGPGVIARAFALPLPEQLLWIAGAAVASTAFFASLRWIKGRAGSHGPASWSVANPDYEITLLSTGEVRSQTRGYDVTRRSYDFLDPAGRALFLVDDSGGRLAWPVVGNYPEGRGPAARLGHSEGRLRVGSEGHGLKTSVEIRPAGRDPAEIWEITVENPSDSPRVVKVVPYLEWVLNRPEADRGHTQYNRLFAEMEYAAGLHAVLAWDHHAKAMGVLAADVRPEGFLTSRMDFIGRARSLWSPRVLETLAFSAHQDTDAHPTFDPIGALLLPLNVPARGSAKVRLVIGLVGDKARAIDLIARHLQIPGAKGHFSERRRKEVHSIGHGEIPPGTPQPYSEFSDDGRAIRVLTPFTPRPYDHAMSNALGHTVMVTNRGLHSSASVNSQQNRITPDWPDTVTKEVPSEAFFLHDPASGEWFSPTYHPLNDPEAEVESDFGVDGTAIFRMSKGSISTELTVFVPPDEPCGVYLLTVRNHADRPRRLHLASYFQIVLAAQPEHAGPLEMGRDEALRALFFTNPRNTYRTGPAFAAVSEPPARVETSRGRFFGPARDVARPSLIAGGRSASPLPRGEAGRDDRPVAAFLVDLQIPSRGERTIVFVLGQAGDRPRAEAAIRRLASHSAAIESLEETRAWWTALMDTLRVQTANPEFDRYLDWLKYQALAERIWARRGFYQSSGAFGFRDQLQDSVNLIWMDPAVAREQILLHASQQFLEGDVVHWFHRLQDGRTGFVARTHASDNLLWLAWGVVEYVGATGDDSLLDESTPHLESELPFPPLPANKAGAGFDPLRSSREDTVYRHALKAIDLVLNKRMGAHGLPLIGTGDWNDGLDEIGSQGRGESVWLGFFLYYILERMAPIVGKKEGDARQDHYLGRLRELGEALESTWRDDRYLRAIHDDGTEIGVKGSGIWEIDALTAAWAVMAGINPGRGRTVFETALSVLEKETTILLGWPPLRDDSKPYLGRSSEYPEGVRENGMYCHGVQWLVGAARLLADRAASEGRPDDARHFREAAYRLWRKVSPLAHVGPDQVEIYGGQPNKQSADMVTTFDPGRMIWHGYTGAAGWMFRQGIEGVLGYRLVDGVVVPPADPDATPEELGEARVERQVESSPLPRAETTHTKTLRFFDGFGVPTASRPDGVSR